MSLPANEAAATPAHLDALTGIRGIAAWLVVLYHIRLSLADILPAPVIAAMAKGYLAVDLFFILSGFVLWYNYADRLRARGLSEAGVFLWRRIARIWPLHAVILALFVAFALVLAATGRSTSGYPFAELPLHLLLAQNWGLTPELSWNHPAWSISTEMAAYLLFPLMVLAAPWDRLRPAALLALALALLGAIHLLFAANGHAALGEDIVRLGLWRCLLEFSLGNVLCLLWLRWRGRPPAARWAAVAGAAALAAGWLFSLPETAFVPGAFAAALMALALGRGSLVKLLGSPLPRYLGEISYSTYLAHYLLFIVFKLAFVDASLEIGWTGFAGFLAMVLAASIGFYHLVEKPAQRKLNRHRPRWPLRPGSLPAE
jgi:peptidoglycan/LPS O-acetylase OafA/YrhL